MYPVDFSDGGEGTENLFLAGAGDSCSQHLVSGGLVPQFCRRAVRHESAFVDNEDTVAGGFDFRQDVGADNDGLFLSDFFDEFSDFNDLVGVQPGGRFIKDEYLGVVYQRLGESEALAVAFGELLDGLVFFVFQTENPYHVIDAGSHLVVRDVVQPGDECEEVHDVHRLVERVVLREVADELFDFAGMLVDGEVTEADVAVVGKQEARHDFHGRCLPGAVRS